MSTILPPLPSVASPQAPSINVNLILDVLTLSGVDMTLLTPELTNHGNPNLNLNRALLALAENVMKVVRSQPGNIEQAEADARILCSLARAISCVEPEDGEVLLELAHQYSEGLTALFAHALEDGL